MNTRHDSNKKRLNILFSALAENYDNYAFIQQEVGRRLLARVEYINFQPSQILDAGCATGFHCQLLAKKFPKARIHGLDISDAMIARANQKKSWFSRQKFLQGDMGQTDFSENSMDFIFSNLALPWVDDVQLCFKEWQRILKPGGLLLFSTLGPDSLKELKQAVDQSSDGIAMPDFIDMHDIGDSLLQNKFIEAVVDVENIQLIFDHLDDLLEELSATGMLQLLLNKNYSQLAQNRFIMERLESMNIKYPEKTQQNVDVYPLSWEVVYGHAWGGNLKKLNPQGEKMANEETFILDGFLKKITRS